MRIEWKCWLMAHEGFIPARHITQDYRILSVFVMYRYSSCLGQTDVRAIAS